MPRMRPVVPVRTPSATRHASDATRLDKQVLPQAGRMRNERPRRCTRCGGRKRPDQRVDGHFNRDSRKSHRFEIAPTASPPSGPNAIAAKTRGRNDTDIVVRSVRATPLPLGDRGDRAENQDRPERRKPVSVRPERRLRRPPYRRAGRPPKPSNEAFQAIISRRISTQTCVSPRRGISFRCRQSPIDRSIQCVRPLFASLSVSPRVER